MPPDPHATARFETSAGQVARRVRQRLAIDIRLEYALRPETGPLGEQLRAEVLGRAQRLLGLWTLEVGSACGAPPRAALPLACSVELLASAGKWGITPQVARALEGRAVTMTALCALPPHRRLRAIASLGIAMGDPRDGWVRLASTLGAVAAGAPSELRQRMEDLGSAVDMARQAALQDGNPALAEARIDQALDRVEAAVGIGGRPLAVLADALVG